MHLSKNQSDRVALEVSTRRESKLLLMLGGVAAIGMTVLLASMISLEIERAQRHARQAAQPLVNGSIVAMGNFSGETHNK